MYIKKLHLLLFYYNRFLYKIIHRIVLNTFENKTIILEINNTKLLFI